ncbi:DUF4349 domain-containing protein [Erythrobacter litoralis]|uniref:DUF4349 domain-containing protein n=1 Tax=Erythrobacter litoralis (strain HTCC2594) TaxID=314225 RepID=Q2NCQ6_ERYLH|nr:DUF4349 domain-containing protein [Erythrobacter litoralis]ABC62535.1 hypothetical protein ELI_02215 [Erythrobacter litoralis HTCC2594]
MRKFVITGAAVSLLALTACSEQVDYEEATVDAADYVEAEAAADAMEAASEEAAAGSAIPSLAELPVSLPKLAYLYDYRWRMPADEIGPLQRRHANLCEQQGPASCQILGMSKSGEEADEVYGELQMAVASRQARAFGALLEDEAEDAGAEQVSAEIGSQELSKQMVDTEARIAARTELRDRLMAVLKTRRGTVEELVEAERSVARVNEEIDQARSWLKEMEGRVAYSRVTVRYETGVPVTNDFLAPVAGAVGSLGTVLGYLVAFLILAGAVALPIGGLVWAGRSINRRFERAAVEG